MHLAMIGLGKMGANMSRRLAKHGHQVSVYDVDLETARTLAQESERMSTESSRQALLQSLPVPRIIWLMVPHTVVDRSIKDLMDAGVSTGDIIIDGGNSNFNETVRRAQQLSQSGIHLIDSGTSGGVWGLENGYSLMVGGDTDAVKLIEPILQALAPSADQGWGHVGPAGAGHYTKMIHNGIEYGMMQAYAEGLELLYENENFELDLNQITHIWQHGSVVRSWLLDLIADAVEQDPGLGQLSDYVDDSGEGRWTIQESIDQAIPTPVLTLALQMRFRSRQDPSYAGKVLNAMRAGFGGHAIKKV